MRLGRHPASKDKTGICYICYSLIRDLFHFRSTPRPHAVSSAFYPRPCNVGKKHEDMGESVGWPRSPHMAWRLQQSYRESGTPRQPRTGRYNKKVGSTASVVCPALNLPWSWKTAGFTEIGGSAHPSKKKRDASHKMQPSHAVSPIFCWSYKQGSRWCGGAVAEEVPCAVANKIRPGPPPRGQARLGALRIATF